MELLIRVFLLGIFLGIIIFVIIRGNPNQANESFFSKYFNPIPVWLLILIIIPMNYEMITESGVAESATDAAIIWIKYLFFYAAMLVSVSELIYVYQEKKMTNLERFEEVEIESKKIDALRSVQRSSEQSKEELEKLVIINRGILESIEGAKKKFGNFAAIVLVLLAFILAELVTK
jgi:hypothetical protein